MIVSKGGCVRPKLAGTSRVALSVVLTAGLTVSACGGGGSSPTPSPVITATPTPSPSPSPSPSPTPTPTGSTFAATGGECDGTAGWLAIADDGMDDTQAIQTSFQQAANKGDTLVIPAGTYNIDDPEGVTATIKNSDFAIVATGAIFVAGPEMNSDLIDFDVTTNTFNGACGGDNAVDITWTGGELDNTLARLSGTIPQGGNIGGTTRGDPVAGTTDALSFRGVVGGSSTLATAPPLKVNSVTVRGVTIVAAPISEANRTAYFANPDSAPAVDSASDTWRNAGGDSGIFFVALGSGLIEDSTFFGIRDASIYVSAAPFAPQLGGNYVMRNNFFYGGFDGISSKRGAQNIRMEGNVLVNIVRGLSLESLSGPLRTTNSQTVERIVTPVVISGNTFNGVQRNIQVEAASDVTVSNNLIRNLGARVAEANNVVRYSRYEGIVLEGVTNGTLSGNTIQGVEGARSTASTTVGITQGSHGGIAGTIVSANITIAGDNVFTNLDSDVE